VDNWLTVKRGVAAGPFTDEWRTALGAGARDIREIFF